MSDFKKCVAELDADAAKLPPLKEWVKIAYEPNSHSTLLARPYLEKLKNVLSCLGINETHTQIWHDYAITLDFRLFNNPYFRLGRLGAAEKMPVDENLKAVIAIGFDEELDYDENTSPELIIWYEHENSTTDISLYSPKMWRDALAEFFETSKKKDTKLRTLDYYLAQPTPA